MKKYASWLIASLVVIYGSWSIYLYLTTFPVVIIYTNDFHGNILPYKGKGGAATIASFIKKIDTPKIILDAGDFFQGTPESDLSLGKNTIIVMNALKYDAACIGNHEFDFGIKNLQKLSSVAKFPFLSANIRDRKTKKIPQFAKSHIIKEINGAKIGIFGLTTDRTPQISIPENVKDIEFLPPIQEAKKAITELQKEGVDVVIALSHLGFEKQKGDCCGNVALAESVGEIDIIISGHTHSTIEGKKIKRTFIVQTKGLGRSVGKLTMRLDKKTKKLRSLRNQIVEMDVVKIGEDEDMKKIVKVISEKITKTLSEKIGTSEGDLLRRSDGESSLGNFLADIMRRWANTDFAFHNSGGIRTDIKKGDITLRDIWTLNPFDNTVVKMKLSGEQIINLLKKSMEGTYGILQVSGLKLVYKKSDRTIQVLVNGKPIDEKKYFTVATNSFLAAGGDGFNTFRQAKESINTNKKFRDIIIEHIRKIKKIPAEATRCDGRILVH